MLLYCQTWKKGLQCYIQETNQSMVKLVDLLTAAISLSEGK